METSLKNLIDSESSTNRIPKVVSTVIALHRNKSSSMIFSRIPMLIALKLDFQPQTLYPEPYRQPHRFPVSATQPCLSPPPKFPIQRSSRSPLSQLFERHTHQLRLPAKHHLLLPLTEDHSRSKPSQ